MVHLACCVWNHASCGRLCESDVKPVGEPDAGNLHVRFDERESETERWDGLRHRHVGESRRQQSLPVPKVTAPILDSTNTPAACGKLTAFVSQVQVQSGKELTQSEANALIITASSVMGKVGCF